MQSFGSLLLVIFTSSSTGTIHNLPQNMPSETMDSKVSVKTQIVWAMILAMNKTYI